MTRPRILLLDGTYRDLYYADLRDGFDAEWLLELTPALESEAASAVDLVVVSQETLPKTVLPLCRLIERDIPTLLVNDGISEWRFIWENHEAGPSLPRFQPVLCHKVACIGRSQARLLESWGNQGKCEVVGLPRLDALRGRQPRQRAAGEPARLLVMTANAPAFTPGQRQRVEQSLRDVKTWIEQPGAGGQVGIEAVWRLTAGLDAPLGVPNEFVDDFGRDLARMLQGVDALVTTPSTGMVEGMLQGIPVALLDYNNCPRYVPAAWSITAREHLDEVIPELLSPPPAKRLYQDTVLHDALECRTPALPRLIRLIEAMIRTTHECRRSGKPLAFPHRILVGEQADLLAVEERFDLRDLYPDQAAYDARDLAALQLEIAHLRRQQQLDAQELEALRKRVAGRNPFSWLRTLLRAAPLPSRLRRALSDRYRRARRRLA